jgi:hypothetical protein
VIVGVWVGFVAKSQDDALETNEDMVGTRPELSEEPSWTGE